MNDENGAVGEDKYYNIIDSKELYSKYQELNQKGLIKPIS